MDRHDLDNFVWNRIDGVYMDTAPKKSFWQKYFIPLIATLFAKLIIASLAGNVYYQQQQHETMQKQVSQQFLIIDALNSLIAELKKQQTSPTSTTEKRYSLDDSPFAKHVGRISDETKTQLRNVCEHIMREEGKRAEPYKDNIGIAIGVGRNLTTFGISNLELKAMNPQANVTDHIDKVSIGEGRIYIQDLETAKTLLKTPLNDHKIALLLLSNLRDTATDAQNVFQYVWEDFDSARKEAVVNLMFNLGLTNFLEFKKLIGHMKKLEYNEASQEVLLSLAAEQNPERYRRISKVIETGDVKYFEE